MVFTDKITLYRLLFTELVGERIETIWQTNPRSATRIIKKFQMNAYKRWLPYLDFSNSSKGLRLVTALKLGLCYRVFKKDLLKSFYGVVASLLNNCELAWVSNIADCLIEGLQLGSPGTFQELEQRTEIAKLFIVDGEVVGSKLIQALWDRNYQLFCGQGEDIVGRIDMGDLLADFPGRSSNLIVSLSTFVAKQGKYLWVLPLYNVGYIAAGTPKSLTFSQN